MNKVVLAIIAFLILGGIGVYWIMAQQAPQRTNHSMTPPDNGDLAERAPIVAVSLPADLSPDAQTGKRVFDAKCAVCHGTDAAGQNGVAPPLVHKIYEPNHHSDMAFIAAARNGVRAHHWNFGDMPPVKGLTNANMKSITRYVRELQRENGIF